LVRVKRVLDRASTTALLLRVLLGSPTS
jgi:hypothetical protein